MSEKVYFITAKTKGDNPKVVFLTDSTVWRFKSNPALIQTLSDCITYSRQEPTHCLFVEAKASLKEELGDIESPISYTELKQLIKEHDCHTVSTKQKSKPAKEEPREYVVYYSPLYSAGYVYYLRGGLETKNKDEAYLMTLDEAEAKVKELGYFKWMIGKQAAINEQLHPTPYSAEEQPQKRVGYVLTKRSLNAFDREKKYRCETDVYVMIGEDIADVFMSKEQADFVCYTRNLLCNPDDAGYHPWQVEQIEF